MSGSVAVTVLALYLTTLAFLMPFACHRSFLLMISRRRKESQNRSPECTQNEVIPQVTVQIPVFNEKHVVERAIDAACALDYPKELLQVQVLDDSTDETTELAERRVALWRERGINVQLHHRKARTGFKAGALAAGLDTAKGDFVLILDADFLPDRSLIQELLPSLADPAVGMVQARWDHLNRRNSWLTRAQAVLLDGHFLLEQAGRYRLGRFFNFNGTAGIWRRQALEEAGGWQHDTLTEDLDISYRAQMAGWRFVFREEVGVPAELPHDVSAFLVQQRRWAQGGVQTARKLLPRLLRGRFPGWVKVESLIHLCGHLAHPLTFLLALLIVPAAAARRTVGVERLWWLDLAVFLAAVGPFMAFYFAAERKRGRGRWKAAKGACEALVLGAGMAPLQCRAVWRGLVGKADPFVRTPKRGTAAQSGYTTLSQGGVLALGAGAAMVMAGGMAVAAGLWAVLPFVALFSTGYLLLGLGVLSGQWQATLGAELSPAADGLGSIEQNDAPHRKPNSEAKPDRLWPDTCGLEGGQPPVSKECEAA